MRQRSLGYRLRVAYCICSRARAAQPRPAASRQLPLALSSCGTVAHAWLSPPRGPVHLLTGSARFGSLLHGGAHAQQLRRCGPCFSHRHHVANRVRSRAACAAQLRLGGTTSAAARAQRVIHTAAFASASPSLSLGYTSAAARAQQLLRGGMPRPPPPRRRSRPLSSGARAVAAVVARRGLYGGHRPRRVASIASAAVALHHRSCASAAGTAPLYAAHTPVHRAHRWQQ